MKVEWIMSNKLDDMVRDRLNALEEKRSQKLKELVEEFPFLEGRIEHILIWEGYWKKESNELNGFGESYLKAIKERKV